MKNEQETYDSFSQLAEALKSNLALNSALRLRAGGESTTRCAFQEGGNCVRLCGNHTNLSPINLTLSLLVAEARENSEYDLNNIQKAFQRYMDEAIGNEVIVKSRCKLKAGSESK